MPPAKAGSDPGAEIEAASMRHAPGLLLFWSGLAGGAAFAAVALHGVPPDAVLLADASLWLGTVCSVALMEAWVKFQAPLLDRWVGVDVGRRVFRGEYAMEGAFALTALALLWHRDGGAAALLASPGAWPLAAAAALLLLDVTLVFPALDLRGKVLIATAAAQQPERLSERQAAYVAALQAELEGRTPPPPQIHLASVLLAAAKAVLLGSAVWHQLLALA